MQTTSDGKCKVIERIDCSGSGDVNMVKEVKPKEDGTIEGLTGRKLTIDPDWKNPSGTFRIGAKRIFDIFPKSLKDRTLKERQESMWDPGHKQSAAQALKRIREFDDCKKNSAPVPATSSNSSGSVSSVSSETKPEQGDQPLVGLDKLYKESLDCELEVLNSLDKKHKVFNVSASCFYDHLTNHMQFIFRRIRVLRQPGDWDQFMTWSVSTTVITGTW